MAKFRIERITVEIDEENAKVAKASSWICDMFQENKVKRFHKQEILRSLIEDFKQQRNRECKAALQQEKDALKIR